MLALRTILQVDNSHIETIEYVLSYGAENPGG